MTKHNFEPTDTSGHAMECIECGVFISIHEPNSWAKETNGECKQ